MDIEWKKIKRVVTGNASEQEKNDVEVWKKEDLRREVFIKDATSYYEKGFPIEDVSSKDVDKACLCEEVDCGSGCFGWSDLGNMVVTL